MASFRQSNQFFITSKLSCLCVGKCASLPLEWCAKTPPAVTIYLSFSLRTASCIIKDALFIVISIENANSNVDTIKCTKKHNATGNIIVVLYYLSIFYYISSLWQRTRSTFFHRRRHHFIIAHIYCFTTFHDLMMQWGCIFLLLFGVRVVAPCKRLKESATSAVEIGYQVKKRPKNAK